MRLVWIGGLVIGSACTSEIARTDTPEITCGSDIECPSGRVCVKGLNKCLRRDAPCVEEQGGEFVPSAEGNECIGNSSSVRSLCFAGVCTASTCGDGFTDPESGEECDTGDARSDRESGACRLDCTRASCGDGVIDPGENCDDGNLQSGDGCRGDCSKTEVCGDLVTDVGETCDDGNLNPNDGCAQCRVTQWQPTVLLGAGARGAVLSAFSVDGPVQFIDAERFWFHSEGRILEGNLASGRAIARVGSETSTTAPSDGADGATVRFAFSPLESTYIAFDGQGNAYFHSANPAYLWVRRSDGRVERLAGRVEGCGGADTTVDAPAFSVCADAGGGPVVDGLGNIYFARNGAQRVRVLREDGMVDDFAGDRLEVADALFTPPTQPVDPLEVEFGHIERLDMNERNQLLIADDAFCNEASPRCDQGVPPRLWLVDNDLIELYAELPVDSNLENARWAPDGTVVADFVRAGIRQISRVERGGALTCLVGCGSVPVANGRSAAEVAFDFERRPRDVAVDPLGRVYFVSGETLYRIEEGALRAVVGPAASPLVWPTSFPGEVLNFAVESDSTLILSVDTEPPLLEAPGSGGPIRPAAVELPADAQAAPHDRRLLVDSEDRLYLWFSDGHRIYREEGGAFMPLVGAGVPGNDPEGTRASEAEIGELRAVTIDEQDRLVFVDRFELEPRLVRVNLRAPSPTLEVLPFPTPLDAGGFQNTFELAARGESVAMATTFSDDATILRYDGTEWTHVFGRLDCDAAPELRFRADETPLPGPLERCHGPPWGGLVIDDDGSLLFFENNNVLLRIADSTLSIVGGRPTNVVSPEPRGDGGPVLGALLGDTDSPVMNETGLYFLSDQQVRRISDGVVELLLGRAYPDDGDFSVASVQGTALIEEPGGSLLATDARGVVKRIDFAAREVQTAYGYPQVIFSGTERYTAETRARYASELKQPAGLVAIDDTTILVNDTGFHATIALDSSATDPTAWTWSPFAGTWGEPGYQSGTSESRRMRAPSGLAFDALKEEVYLADRDNHVIRAWSLNGNEERVVAGSVARRGFAGDGGEATAALLNEPKAIALRVGENGAPTHLYIADSRNHRVRIVDLDTHRIDTVLGDGVPTVSGTGRPARLFSVNEPAGLALDRFSNLFISSRTSVRRVSAGSDGIATGDDDVATLYGRSLATGYPQEATDCLAGVVVPSASVSASRILVTDQCLGLLLALDRVDAAP